jgi:hypothetical protein
MKIKVNARDERSSEEPLTRLQEQLDEINDPSAGRGDQVGVVVVARSREAEVVVPLIGFRESSALHDGALDLLRTVMGGACIVGSIADDIVVARTTPADPVVIDDTHRQAALILDDHFRTGLAYGRVEAVELYRRARAALLLREGRSVVWEPALDRLLAVAHDDGAVRHEPVVELTTGRILGVRSTVAAGVSPVLRDGLLAEQRAILDECQQLVGLWWDVDVGEDWLTGRGLDLRLAPDHIVEVRFHSEPSAELAADVVAFCGSLGLLTVAARVDDAQRARFLADLGFEAGRGPLWTEPLRASELVALVARLPGGVFPSWSASDPTPDLESLSLMLRLSRRGASESSIASALNHAGVRTANDREWRSSSVRHALSRIASAG